MGGVARSVRRSRERRRAEPCGDGALEGRVTALFDSAVPDAP